MPCRHLSSTCRCWRCARSRCRPWVFPRRTSATCPSSPTTAAARSSRTSHPRRTNPPTARSSHPLTTIKTSPTKRKKRKKVNCVNYVLYRRKSYCFCRFDFFCSLFEKDSFFPKICILHCLVALNSVLFKPCLF